VLFYDLDADVETAYGLVHSWAEQLASCQRAWHISAEARVRDGKYHAGAGKLIARSITSIKEASPPYLQSNVEPVAIGVGRQTLYLFPDRLLVYDTTGVGAVGYPNLVLSVREARFIETDTVPTDAKVVDRTWQYVNKKGGPDLRFKDNRELPICLYDELTFNSTTGLNEMIQVSRCGVVEGFLKAITYLSSTLSDIEHEPSDATD
jgi:hypothetical protein